MRANHTTRNALWQIWYTIPKKICRKSHGCNDEKDKTGVADYANNNVITIFPNPASSKIKIIGAGDEVKAEFVSLAGSIVKVSDKAEISLEDVASGVYMLRITTPSETVVKKLVVKK